MSRRRRPAARFPSDRPEIRLCCTDRGQHAPIILGELIDGRTQPWTFTEDTIARHDAVTVALGAQPGTPPEPYVHAGFAYRGRDGGWQRLATSDRPAGGRTFRFHCAQCGRSPEIRSERVGAVVDRWRDTGQSLLDVSWCD